jgi:16S rRNA (guanine527-N7)-methyltransferase
LDNTALQTGANTLGISLSEEMLSQFSEYLKALAEWNRTYNLTAIPPKKWLTHHLLDSLSIAPYIQGDRILDAGTGAGFPGIPLAILFPEKKFVLLDSNGKKVRFLNHVVRILKLTNVTPLQARMDALEENVGSFDIITSRALGTADELLSATQNLLKPEGCWLLMKGDIPEDELQGLAYPIEVQRLAVPGLHAKRHLIIVSKRKEP